MTTPSHWSITSPVSLDPKPSSPGHQAMDLQSSPTVLASMSLDVQIPQYDGADDSESQDCELCEAQFSGKNRYANKRTHQINHHFKEEVYSKVTAPVNGLFSCNYTDCKFSTKKRLDMARHISSSHHLLKSLLEERVRLNKASSQPGSEAQPLDAHSGQSLHNDTNEPGLQPLPPTGHSGQPLNLPGHSDQAQPLPVHSGPSKPPGDRSEHSTQPKPPHGHSGLPDIHPQSSCHSSKTDVSTSMDMTQVKYLREK